MYDFKGKVAIVTGGTDGIGRGCTETFAQCGATVVVAQRDSKNRAHVVIDEMKAKGLDVDFIKADISVYDDIRRIVDYTLEKYGKIDFLINNAGVAEGKTEIWVTRAPKEKWDEIIATDLTGTVLLSQLVCNQMMKQGYGHVVSIASAAGVQGGNTCGPAYAVAKAGVMTMTRYIRRDYAQYGITANALCPGIINTDILKGCPPEVLDALAAGNPSGRVGDPAEVGKTCAFLCSDGAGYINGQSLLICGGAFDR